MAILNNDSIFAGMRGKIGGLVIRQYRDRIVVSSVPDMSKVQPTQLQKAGRSRFGAAVAYAKSILEDPKKKKAYEKKLKEGERLFQYVMKEYYQKAAAGMSKKRR